MRTDSTCTRCAVADDELALLLVDPVALDALDSSRPLISTSWFACVFSSAESPSSR